MKKPSAHTPADIGSNERTRLYGHFLWLVRIVWLLLLALTISLLIANAPTNIVYARLEYDVQQARQAILTFTSLPTFAGWLVAGRWLIVAVYFAVALLIAWRRWHDWFALAVSAALLALAWGFVMRGDRNTWLYPAVLQPLALEITFVLSQLLATALVLLFFLFPNGRFIFRWHKWPALLAIVATALFFHADTFRFTWRAYHSFLEQWAWSLWGAFLLGSLMIAMAGQVYRYRYLATPVQRQQMKWVLLGLVGLLAIPLISLPLLDFGGAWGALAAIGVQLAAVAFLPITLALSILRYQLWEVDLLINRTLVFGGLTVLVLLLYMLVVGLLGTLFQGGDNLFLSILATGLIAILFEPLRQRLQRGVNRLRYGRRDEPMAVLAQLGERLENSADPETLLPTAVETIANVLKLPYVAIQPQGDGQVVSAGAFRPPPFLPLTLPLTFQTQNVGTLTVLPREPVDTFSRRELALLQEVARQLAVAVHAARLHRELRLTRQQLVTAQAEERRRVSRALGDGLGAQLAALLMQTDTARQELPTDPDTAVNAIQSLKTGTQTAVQTVRSLVQSLEK